MAEAAEAIGALGSALLAGRFNTSQRSGILVVVCSLRWGEVVRKKKIVRKKGILIGEGDCELFLGETLGPAEVHSF